MSDHTPFLTIFPECAPLGVMAGGLEKAYVTDVQIAAAEKTMTIKAWFSSMPSPAETSRLGGHISDVFGLRSAVIDPDYPPPPAAPVVTVRLHPCLPPRWLKSGKSALRRRRKPEEKTL